MLEEPLPHGIAVDAILRELFPVTTGVEPQNRVEHRFSGALKTYVHQPASAAEVIHHFDGRMENGRLEGMLPAMKRRAAARLRLANS
jgi:hypothetical protein